MKDKRTTLLIVITIVTLLVLVAGATFAYFASSQDDYANGNVHIVTNTAGTASVFDATGGSLEMNITNAMMVEANNDTENSVHQIQIIF